MFDPQIFFNLNNNFLINSCIHIVILELEMLMKVKTKEKLNCSYCCCCFSGQKSTTRNVDFTSTQLLPEARRTANVSLSPLGFVVL